MTDNIAALPEEIAGLIERLHDPYHSRDEAYKAAAVLRALVQENERLRLAVTNKSQELADRIRELEAERTDRIRKLEAERDAVAVAIHRRADRIRELEAERNEWKDRAERPWANARKAWEEHYDGLKAERDAIRTKTFEDCLAIIPGGTHCDPQEIADAIRALAQTR